ncbi:MAG: radical SAM protein [Candidatus Nanoarchaeia archaeon]
MKTTLIFPPFEREINDNLQISTVKKFAGVPVPLSLMYIAATLEQAGHDVTILDANALGYTKDQIISYLKERKVEVVGLTVTTLTYHKEAAWIEAIKKELPDVTMIVGGKHAWYYSKELLKNKYIDYVFVGEADNSIVEFANAWDKDQKKLKKIKGVWSRNGNKIIDNGMSDPITDLDSLPFPARHMLPLGNYCTFITKKQKFSTMITTRGCVGRCTFCDGHLDRYRARSAEKVVQEMQLAYDMGVREIELYDDAFTINKQRARDICEGIKKRKLKLRWDMRTRVDMVDEEILKILKSAGCCRINYGIESGDQGILNFMKKDITLEKVEKAVLLSKKLGFEVFGYFILGCPGETEETLKKTIEFSRKYPFDYVQFTRMVPLPRTELYRQYMEEKGQDYWLEYTQGQHKDEQIHLVGTQLSEKRIEEAVKNAYRGFYLRPKQVLKTLLRTRSFGELNKYISAGINFVFKK